MAYQEFAYFYDEFNGAADYDALFAYVISVLRVRLLDGLLSIYR